MATLELYKEKYRYLSRSKIVEERREILHSINGDAFFPLDWWPDDMKLLFWKILLQIWTLLTRVVPARGRLSARFVQKVDIVFAVLGNSAAR